MSIEIDAESPMPLEQFWAIIEETTPEEDETTALVDRLAELGQEGACAFYARLAICLRLLDTRAHASVEPGEYLSPDYFLYRRLYVVSKGARCFEDYISSPRCIPEETCEDLKQAPAEAISRITGDSEVWLYTPFKFETGHNKEGWA